MKHFFTSLLILSSFFYFSQVSRPKLVVGVVVDQMRDEYLDRFYNDFGNDGFKRLINNGYRLKNMHFDYSPTYTAPGHSSVYTGCTPAYHGIVGNYWYKRNEHKDVYCTADDNFDGLGITLEEREGKHSPHRLKTSTMTDELKLSTNFKGKVFAASIKDRGAILPGGHFADWAFWMSDSGNFISSTYYGKELPKYVKSFNEKKYYEKYINQNWDLLKDPKEYNESVDDESEFEGKLGDILNAKFPYDLKSIYKDVGPEIIKVTPYGNNILADFAKEIVVNENLGQDEITDFLAVSFSSTDYIGHLLGPRSMELQDTYLRLDLTIADLLQFLDKKVGKNNYILFLTADHACAENPNFLKEHRLDVKNLDRKEIAKGIEEFSNETFGQNLVENYSSNNLFLDTGKIQQAGLDVDDVARKFQSYFLTLPFVRIALTEEQILSSTDNYIYKKIANGYDVKQNGQVIAVYESGYYEYPKYGTTHGTPYTYDTHVPMLWYGREIPQGINYNHHNITEIAPTVMQLLHMTLPSGSNNIVISELMDK